MKVPFDVAHVFSIYGSLAPRPSLLLVVIILIELFLMWLVFVCVQRFFVAISFMLRSFSSLSSELPNNFRWLRYYLMQAHITRQLLFPNSLLYVCIGKARPSAYLSILWFNPLTNGLRKMFALSLTVIQKAFP
jgi:hypothetical protein